MIFPEKHPDNCSNLRKKSRVKSKQKKKRKKKGREEERPQYSLLLMIPLLPGSIYICIIKERERFGLTGEKGFGICKI